MASPSAPQAARPPGPPPAAAPATSARAFPPVAASPPSNPAPPPPPAPPSSPSSTQAPASGFPLPTPPALSHPLLVGEPLERRAYQETIAAACRQQSTLVVLPTGLGKTVIALLVILEALDHGKVLFLAPTKPLAEQHYEFLRSRLRAPPDESVEGEAKGGRRGKGKSSVAERSEAAEGGGQHSWPVKVGGSVGAGAGEAAAEGPAGDKGGTAARGAAAAPSHGAVGVGAGAAAAQAKGEEGPSVSIALFTGAVAPAKREAAYGRVQLIVATPQVIENDILQRRLNLKEFALVVYDEAHRAVGNYAYVFVAEVHRAARGFGAERTDEAGEAGGVAGVAGAVGTEAAEAAGTRAGKGGRAAGAAAAGVAAEATAEAGTAGAAGAAGAAGRGAETGVAASGGARVEAGVGGGAGAAPPDGPGTFGALALGMTASPGSQKGQILEVCANLGLTHIEKRSDFDTDVIRYVHPIQTHWLHVELPEQMKQVRQELQIACQSATKRLHSWGLLPRPKLISTKMLLDCGRAIEQRLHASGGQPPAYLYQARSLQAMALKLNHAQEVAETQGLEQLVSYFAKLESELHVGRPSRATKKLAVNPHVQRAAKLARESQADHPKLTRLVRLVGQLLERKPQGQYIVFANYRVTAELVVDRLSRVAGARPVRFVGQGRREGNKGLTQKQQKEILEAFRAGEYNLLVATSVGEEGLDIPSTDGVIFYEPVPSAIRLIQRRGRTGRQRPGAVYILITKDSRDEAFYWASRHREKQMRSLLQRGFPAEELALELPSEAELRAAARQAATARAAQTAREDDKAPAATPSSGSPPSPPVPSPPSSQPAPTIVKGAEPREAPSPTQPSPSPYASPLLQPSPKGQASLGDFEAPAPPPEHLPEILVDHRELASGVARELHRRGLALKAEQLPVGDFLIGAGVGVERKTTEDFLASLIEGKLFGQVRALAAAFPRPLLLLEGTDLFTRRQIDSEALYGALAAIVADFGVPLLATADEKETAAVLAALVARDKRLHMGGRPVPVRGSKPGLSPGERQRYLVEGLPGVSAALAERLLDHFGSVGALFSADEQALREVAGIGPRKARAIVEVVKRPWKAAGR